MKLFTLILASILLVSSCSKTEEAIVKNVSFATVASGSIAGTDRIESIVQWRDSAELSFKSSGRISEMNVRIGQAVKKWDVLAKLSGEESSIMALGTRNIVFWLSAGADSASVRSALLEMRKSTDNLYASRLQSASADIDSAKIRLEIAKNDAKLSEDNLKNSRDMLSGSVLTATERQAQAKYSLELVKNQLANTTELLNSEESSLYRSSLASLSNAFILARTAREYADLFIGVSDENRNKNDSFENHFDDGTKTKAEKSFHDFDIKYRETYDWYYANVANRSSVEPTVTKEALARAIPTLEALRDTLHSIKNILDTAISGTTFPQSAIDAYQLKTNEYLTGIEQALNAPTGGGLQGSKNAIETFDRNRKLKISELNDSVALAEKNLSLADIGKDVTGSSFQKDLNGLKTELGIKKDNVKLAEKSVTQSKNAQTVLESERKAKLGEIDAQIAELKSKLAEAKMQAGLAGNSVENQSLRAPFDGIILKKYSDAGTVVGAGTPVLSISSQAGEKVVISADGKKYDLKKWNRISLMTAEGKFLTGTIASSSPVKHGETGKNSLEITLSSSGITAGERVWAIPETNGDEGLLIPIRSVVTKYSIPSVYVVQTDSTVRLIPVKILESNADFARIEGISAGTPVVTDGKDALLDGEKVAIFTR